MKSDNFVVSVVAALAIGVVQFLLLNYFWTIIILYVRPVFWLLDHGVTGANLKVLLFFVDNTLNLALSLPAALALCALRPRRIALYLALAVLPAFLWQYQLFFGSTPPSLPWTAFLPGIVSAALTLPLAVWIARRLARPQ